MAVKNLRARKLAKMERKRAEKHQAHKEAERRGRNGNFDNPWGSSATSAQPQQ